MTALLRPAALADLEVMARSLFPPEVAVVASDPRLDHTGLMPEEAHAIVAATLKRRREFVAGRVAARRAMAVLGVHGVAVPCGPDRAPIWPAGIVGGISHTEAACIAAAALATHVRALGIDIEPDAPLAQDLWASVCTEAELAWLETLPPAARGRAARLIFSAKECAYKCQYSLTRTFLDFDAIRIDPDPIPSTFQAVFTSAVGPFPAGARMAGRIAYGAGLILCACSLSSLGGVSVASPDVL